MKNKRISFFMISIILLGLLITGCSSEKDFYDGNPTDQEGLNQLIDDIAEGNKLTVLESVDESTISWFQENKNLDIVNKNSDWEEFHFQILRILNNGITEKDENHYFPTFYKEYLDKLNENTAVTLLLEKGITYVTKEPVFESEVLYELDSFTTVQILEENFIEEVNENEIYNFTKVKMEDGTIGYILKDELYRNVDFPLLLEYKNGTWYISYFNSLK